MVITLCVWYTALRATTRLKRCASTSLLGDNSRCRQRHEQHEHAMRLDTTFHVHLWVIFPWLENRHPKTPEFSVWQSSHGLVLRFPVVQPWVGNNSPGARATADAAVWIIQLYPVRRPQWVCVCAALYVTNNVRNGVQYHVVNPRDVVIVEHVIRRTWMTLGWFLSRGSVRNDRFVRSVCRKGQGVRPWAVTWRSSLWLWNSIWEHVSFVFVNSLLTTRLS